MTSIFTTEIKLELPARNDYLNTWDTPVNNNFKTISAKLGGALPLTAATSTIVLTQGQALNAVIVLTGAATQSQVIQIPAGISGIYLFRNWTTGGYFAALQTAAGGSSVFASPGTQIAAFCDGTDVFPLDQSQTPPGTVLASLSPTVPAGFVLCYGQLLSRAAYPGIYMAIGTAFGAGDGSTTFQMPDFRGTTLAGADNMGGAARNILTSFGNNGQSLGAMGGEQSHVLSVAELAAHNHGITDPGHGHSYNDPGHSHSYQETNNTNYYAQTNSPTANTNAGAYGAQTGGSGTNIGINNSATGISVNSQGSSTPHNNVQPTIIVNWIMKT